MKEAKAECSRSCWRNIAISPTTHKPGVRSVHRCPEKKWPHLGVGPHRNVRLEGTKLTFALLSVCTVFPLVRDRIAVCRSHSCPDAEPGGVVGAIACLQ